MKRRMIGIGLLCATLVFVLCCWGNGDDRLDQAFQDYAAVVNEELPEDLCLTVYYLPSSIVTRAPLTVEELIDFSYTVNIVVGSDELVQHQELLQELSASNLEINRRKPLINARLHYVFSTNENDNLLNVTINGGALGSRCPQVNGIHVKDSEALYNLLAPFLSESECEMFGIPFERYGG